MACGKAQGALNAVAADEMYKMRHARLSDGEDPCTTT
jgi:hypothetical protein